LRINVIFLVIPGLIKGCILGISTLREYGCIINLPQNTIKLTKNLNNQQPVGENNVFKMLNMQTVFDEMETEMINKVNEMEGVTNEQKQKLMQILRRNQEVFSDKPGRIEYDCDVIHCSGKENTVADILSRYPEDLTNQYGIKLS
jgi:nitric oxide reductase large subunit